jgi:hypothetical protein
VLANADHRLVKQRALFGLARAHEARDELKKAVENYAELAKKYPDGPYAEQSAKRLKDLESEPTKKFYDWFAAYEPPRSKRLPGTPGEKPDENFLDDFDAPGVSLPSSIDGQAAPGKDSLPLPDSSAAPASETPAPDAEKPDSAPDKATDEKP